MTAPRSVPASRFPCAFLLAFGLLLGAAAPANTPQGPSQGASAAGGVSWSAVSDGMDRQLDDDSDALRAVTAALNGGSGASGTVPSLRAAELNDLAARVSAVQKDTQDAIRRVESYQATTESYLKILGAKPAANEDPSVTAQRQSLQRDAQAMQATLMRARLYNLQARQLSDAISARLARVQQATLSQRTDSPLSPDFWRKLVTERTENRSSLHGGALTDWPWLIGGTALSLLCIGLVSPFSLRLLNRTGARLSNAGTGVKDALAGSVTAIALNGIVCGLLGWLVWLIWSAAAMDGDGGPIAAAIGESLPLCGFVIGAGLPVFGRQGVLAEKLPEGRDALRGTDWLLACDVLALNVVRALTTQASFGAGILSLLQIAFSLAIGMEATLTFRRLRRENTLPAIAPPALGVSVLLSGVTIVAILLGYISFAFMLNGWLLSLGTGIAVVVLLGLCWRETLDRLLDPAGFLGARLRGFGIPQRRLTQASVLLSGAGNVLLLMLLLSIPQADGSFSIANIGGHLHALFVGKTINGVTFSLDTLILCVLLLLGASYAIRLVRRWISDRLLPTTALDTGTRASVLTIFTYCSWILVGLTVLSVAGVSVRNLTWVVSALSVGIGFGLQSIVQNFVSGIILMAERPVRIGDVVTIGGDSGEIRRISIRTTDISLGDGSTLIVPNSQFITASVKNSTFSGASSALTMKFRVPTTTDIDKARAMLIEVAAKRPDVLSNPGPSVLITELSNFSVTMSLAVQVLSVRNVAAVQDSILFDVFRRFSAENVTITTA